MNSKVKRQRVHSVLGSRNFAKEDRQKDDYYSTPTKTVEQLILLEKFRNRVWSPACGSGNISKVFEECGHSVRSTDVKYRGYGERKSLDFLTVTEKWNGDIVENPPFKLCVEFVRKALAITDDKAKIAMFLRIQFFESQERRKLWDEGLGPTRCYVASNRVQCAKDGNFKKLKGTSGAMAFCWFIWSKPEMRKNKNRETIVKLFN